jgi:SWI/SNF-related matrix-associated actin-dependent regulator of chromatin subfamily A3
MQVSTSLLQFQKTTVDFLIKRELTQSNSLLLNDTGTGKTLCILKVLEKHPKNTVIICPSNLIENWINEFSLHSNISRNNICVFHGINRKFDKSKSITITSYNIISNEIKKDISFPQTFNFERIILDECHFIRNHKSLCSIGILQLNAPYKIAITATPIFNKLQDFSPILIFLFELDKFIFKQWISSKDRLSCSKNMKELQSFINKNSIRFMKDTVLTLPKKHIFNIKLDFSIDERKFYDTLLEYCLDRIDKTNNEIKKNKFKQNKTLVKIFSCSLLVFILRLKQAVNNPSDILNSMKRLSRKCITNMNDATFYLQQLNSLEIEEEECPICFDSVSDSLISPCSHAFCSNCVDKLLSKKLKCPICRCIIDIDNTSCQKQALTCLPKCLESSKINFITKKVDDIILSGDKVIIVSQYINMLESVKENLSKHISISIQGNIPVEKRFDSIKKFQSDDNVKLCFLSMNCSSDGITLTAGNHLFLCDMYWNYSKIEQVSNRIHRIGQTKDCYIYNIMISDTIEQNLLKIINKKRILSKLILETSYETIYEDTDIDTLTEKIQLL